MASSCDEDFSLLGDDNHHHHIIHHPYRYPTKSTPIHAPPESVLPLDGEEDRQDNNETDSAFADVNPYSDNETSKRSEREGEIDGGETPYNIYKRGRSGGGEYRKDREEWSDVAIGCLLDAYMEKFTQLSRGNLRGRDWEEVAAMVKQGKSVEQCKNKVDNLKKRYKLERHRITTGSISTSHWPWFQKMEDIVGNSLPIKVAPPAPAPADEDNGGGGGGASSASVSRQSKRYANTIASPAGQTNNMMPKSMSKTRWRRVILKISGVALAGTGPNNIDPKVMTLIAREVAMACQLGLEIAIVVGARNFFCGNTWVTATGSHRRTAYQIGMMASVMNSLLLQSALEKTGIQTRVQTAFAMQEVSEPYSRQRAIRHLEKGRVVIFGGIGAGTGNPLFSTDTAAAVQASEIHAEAVLKGTNVDGVYDCHSPDSNFVFEHISIRDLVSRGATSMDMMALTFCEENNIPVVVFNLLEPGNISKALCGEQVGTLIDQTGRIG
ncbi:hypothetical protein POTOM_025376 [Populus tomentosa]|uniref:Uridine monophosphate kinase n=1 Tax=Populus tomentosa TaxID=118781 RepID=A0A8X8CX35_POPTO|nr:hypothetical protein POTOM_025376 [Populus tomentosa]